MSVKETAATGDDAQGAARGGVTTKRAAVARKKIAPAKPAAPKAAKKVAGTKTGETKPAESKNTGTKTTATKTAKPTTGRKKAATAARSASGRKVGTKPKPAPSTKPVLAPDERHRLICEAAYLISTRRDPAMGNPDSDWLHAETVIDMIFDIREPKRIA